MNSPVSSLKNMWEELAKKNDSPNSSPTLQKNSKLAPIPRKESLTSNQNQLIIKEEPRIEIEVETDSLNDELSDSTNGDVDSIEAVQVDVDKLTLEITEPEDEYEHDGEFLHNGLTVNPNFEKRESSYEEIPFSPTIHLNVFGSSIVEQVNNDGGEIPIPVLAFISVLDNRIQKLVDKLATPPQGLFRESGNTVTIENLKNKLNKGMHVTLKNEETNDLAALLKAYFRELPVLLFPPESYDSLIAIGQRILEIGNSIRDIQNPTEKQEQYQHLLSDRIIPRLRNEVASLPLAHRNTASVLFSFLHRVSCVKETKMTADNLSICWAPNLFGTPSKLLPHEGLMHMPYTKCVVSTLIDFHNLIFDHVEISPQTKQAAQIFGLGTLKVIDVAKNVEQEVEERNPEECVDLLKQGGMLVKYITASGRLGTSHFRFFQLSDDAKHLVWSSKSEKQKSLSLEGIKLYPESKKARNSRKNQHVPSWSFSLVDGSKSYDFKCASKQDHQMWVSGLACALAGTIGSPHNRSSSGKSNAKQEFELRYASLGDAYTWGLGARGALGHGDEQDLTKPQVIKDLLKLDVKAIVCGDTASAAITTMGKLLTFGACDHYRLGHAGDSDHTLPAYVGAFTDIKVVQACIGIAHTLVLDDKGVVYSIGNNTYGQLAATASDKLVKPCAITLLSDYKIMYVACGKYHSGVIDNQGRLLTFGRGTKGQLGSGQLTNSSTPILVNLNGHRALMCSMGVSHTLVLCDGGNVYSFGGNKSGQLGHGNTDQQPTPTLVSFFSKYRIKAVQASAGGNHCAIIAENGDLYTFGSNSHGQLGCGSIIDSHYPAKVQGFADNPVTQVSCGDKHTMVMVEESHTVMVYAFGSGKHGELGIDKAEDQTKPTKIEFLQDKHVRSISCGAMHSGCVCSHQWVPDKDVTNCMACKTTFTVTRRRHHCRNCGGIFCNSCSSSRIQLLRYGNLKQVRVCSDCYDVLAS